MGTVQVLPATRNAARRYKAELTLLICGVSQPDAVLSALRTAEQTFADRLEADGIDLAENGTRVVSDPFLAGTDVAIHADLGDAPGRIVDRWVHLIAELAAVDPGVTDVRLPRRRSRIAGLLLETPMLTMTPASWTGQAPSSWLIASARWLTDTQAAQYVAYLNGVEFDVDRSRLAEQLAIATDLTPGSLALVALRGKTLLRIVHAGAGQLVWSMPSPDVADDNGWAAATDDLAWAAGVLRPRPAWACLFANSQYVLMLPPLRPGRQAGVPVHECLVDPRWGLPDAYPVVLLPSDWAAACGLSPSARQPSDELVRLDVADPRAFIPVPFVPRTAEHDAVVRSARERLAPVLASRLREPPPTDEEVAQGLGRRSWRHRRYGPPSQERIVGWLAESGRELTHSTAGRGYVEIGLADLETVEACVDAWRADPAKDRVDSRIALFLGEVLFASLPESRWDTRGNGEPVITLQDGREIDLLALARQRVDRGRPALPSVLRGLLPR
jgi:hypothetical protein